MNKNVTIKAGRPDGRPSGRCPDCGGPLVHGEGCTCCPVCGFTRC